MSMRLILLSAGSGASLLVSVIGLAQERPTGQPSEHRNGVAAIVDQRTAIMLSDDESAFVRREMRGLLESVRDILDASSAGDRARLAEAARRAGLNGPEAEHIPKSLAPKLPPEFKKLGLATHRGFDQIALDVEQSGATDRAPKQLVELMGNCLACHATWRLVGDGQR
jgi:hypothetical protein